MPDINTITFEDLFESYNSKDMPDNKSYLAAITALFNALSPDQKNAEEVAAGDINDGLFEHLTDNERNALVLDKNMQARMSIRNGELYFDDISLRTRSPQANPERLEELKKSISVSYSAHLLERGSEFVGFDSYSLNMNKTNLKDALSLLDSTNHWYNSSSEFRSMYSSLKTLSESSAKLKPEDLSADDPARYEAYLKDLRASRKAVENYLTHKGALDGTKNSFKNSYEADRVAAARGLLRTLREKETSLVLNRKVLEAGVKYDRFADYLAKTHNIDRQELADLKYNYCNVERVRMHEKAKAAVNKMNRNADAMQEQFKQKFGKDIPAAFKGTFAAYITNNSENNDHLMEDLNRVEGEKKSRHAVSRMQKKYMNGLSSASSLEKSRLAVNKDQTSTEAAEYAIQHYTAAVQGEQIHFSVSNMRNALGMTAKNNEISAEINQGSKLGTAGYDLVQLMADENAFFLPLDEFVKNNQVPDFILADAKLGESSLLKKEKASLEKFYNCIQSQTRDLPSVKETAPHAFREEDFNGIVKVEAKVPKQLAYDITAEPDVLTFAKGSGLVEGSINDVEDEPQEIAAGGNNNEDSNLHDDRKKPETLLNDYIRQMPADAAEKAKFLLISTEIRNARARIQANSQAHNIYPQAADDMKMLVIAEEIKQELLYKKSHPAKNTKNFLVNRLLTVATEEPVDRFRQECENRNLEKSFNKKMETVENARSRMDQKDLIFSDDIMKDFATGNGAKKLFETYVNENAAVQKKRDENVKVVPTISSPVLQ